MVKAYKLNFLNNVYHIAINKQTIYFFKDNNDSVKEIFLYNSEYFIIVEENLNYFQTSETLCQFKLVEMHKIVDIANLVRPDLQIHWILSYF